MNFNEKSIVSVKSYNQGEPDKNGKLPVILQVENGKAFNRIVLSGTVAENAGFEVGKTYLASQREIDPHERYGRQFIWSTIKELTFDEIMGGMKHLGAVTIYDADKDGRVPVGQTEEQTQEQSVPANQDVE